MKSNIFEYKKLQDEALVIENRINRLEEVKKYYDLYAKERDYFNIYQYIIEKSELEISKEKLTSLKNELTKNIDRIKEIDNELNENKASQMELENNRFKLINERANNDTLKITKDLMDQRKETQKKIDDINSELKIVKDNLFTYTSNFIKASETLINKLNTLPETEKFDRTFQKQPTSISDRMRRQVVRLADNLDLSIKGQIENLQNVIKAELDDQGNKIVVIYSDEGYEHFIRNQQ